MVPEAIKTTPAARDTKASLFKRRHFFYDSDQESYLNETFDADLLPAFAAAPKRNAHQDSTSSDSEDPFLTDPKTSEPDRADSQSPHTIFRKITESSLTDSATGAENTEGPLPQNASNPPQQRQDCQEETLGRDECDEDGKYYFNNAEEDERSRLMAAVVAASVPSEDSFSDESSRSEPGNVRITRKTAVTRTISSAKTLDDIHRQDLDPEEDSSLLSQESEWLSDDDEKEEAGQQAKEDYRPNQSRISGGRDQSRISKAKDQSRISTGREVKAVDETGHLEAGFRVPVSSRSQPGTVRITRESTESVTTSTAKTLEDIDRQELDSDENSSLLSSETESLSGDDEDEEETRIAHNNEDYYYRRNSAGRDMKPIDRGGHLDGGGGGGGEAGGKKKGTTKRSASFPATISCSSSFKWSKVKSKIFYSFRALKASSGSGEDGTKAISVKNLGSEVTHATIHAFFQDAGAITDIKITRQPHSIAYVEFQSGAAARKAVLQKSGKKLEGRVISCAIAYENFSNSGPGGRKGRRSQFLKSDSARGEREKSQSGLRIFGPELEEGDAKFLGRFNERVSNSSPGRKGPQCQLSESDSSGGGREETQSSLRIFGLELQEGDAKFLSRFNYQPSYAYGHVNPPPLGFPQLVNAPGREHDTRGGTETSPSPRSRSYANLFSMGGRTKAFPDESPGFDEGSLDLVQISSASSRRRWRGVAWPSLRRWRRKSRWVKLIRPWRVQWWRFAKISSVNWATRRSCSGRPKVVDHAKQKTFHQHMSTVG